MGTTFSTLSHSLHQECAGSLKNLGHSHQVMAAALGYKAFAAYKTSSEAQATYDGARHVVIANQLVGDRLAQLGYPDPEKLTQTLVRALIKVLDLELDNVSIHLGPDDLFDDLRVAVETEIEESDVYLSEFATTNAYGGEFETWFSPVVDIDQAASGDWQVEVEGTSSLEQDPDRVYHGDVLSVSAQLNFPKLGRRVLGEMVIEEIVATVKMDEEPDLEE